jgi:nicotinamidase/pyrazinamidase
MARKVSTDGGTALLVVDAQPTFMPGGELPVPDGDRILAPLRELIRSHQFTLLAFSRDWHPPNHFSFAPRPRFAYGSWPPHGIADSTNAQVHPSLIDSARTAGLDPLIISKGMDANIEAYSAFDGINLDTSRRLAEELEDHGIHTVTVAGLAGEVCVEATVLAALRLGLPTRLYLDGTAFLGESQPSIARMRSAGATIL